jgi:pyruvate formate lyase activating enzyme
LQEARFWSATGQGDGACLCRLCAHGCRIAEGRRGLCRVRENRGGTLYSLVYGLVTSSHLDPIEKKPLYHYLPGTTSFSIATPGCNFRCDYCQNWQISQPDVIPQTGKRRVTPEQIVAAALKAGAATIAYTYTEPTIFMELALDCAALAHARGIGNVFVTNGYESAEAVEAMTGLTGMPGLIDAANVDLKAFTDEFYRKRCGARLQPVLDSIRAMHAAGIHLEVTTLIIPGMNDGDDELRGIAEFLAGISLDMVWHISRFHPQYQLVTCPPTPPETMARAAEIGREAGLRYVYQGNIRTPNGQTTFCPGCGRALIERQGYARPAMHLDGKSCPDCGAEIPIVLSAT